VADYDIDSSSKQGVLKMKKFDGEFKANADHLVMAEGMKIKDVAPDLGVGKFTLA